MPTQLPPNILAMFKARAPVEYLEPVRKRKMSSYTGIAAFLGRCDDPKLEGYNYGPGFESRMLKKKKMVAEQKEKYEKTLSEKKEEYSPGGNEKVVGDAYKTLIVARLPYEITEPALRREFESFGAVRKVKLIFDKEGKPRGYGFIEFERERDMRVAYKEADGQRLLGRRILVDVERGRTVQNWVPRRLGGGIGNPRPQMQSKQKRRSDSPVRFRGAPPHNNFRPCFGGFRGERRGGYGEGGRFGGERGYGGRRERGNGGRRDGGYGGGRFGGGRGYGDRRGGYGRGGRFGGDRGYGGDREFRGGKDEGRGYSGGDFKRRRY